MFIYSILLIFIIFTTRPSLLGELYSVAGLSVALLSCITALALKELRPLNYIDIPLFSLPILLWFYLFAAGSLQDSNIEYLAKALFGSTATIVMCYSIMGFERLYPTFEKMFVRVMGVLGFLGAISYVLALIFGVEAIRMYELYTPNYMRASRVIFPFGVVYHDYSFYTRGTESTIWRMQSVFREAGIAQCFYLWTMSLGIIKTYPRWTVLGSFLGVVASFSTIGVALFCMVASYFLFIRSKQLNTTIRIICFFTTPLIGYLVLYYAPVVGLVHKVKTHTASVQGRLDSFMFGEYSNLIFGNGLYSSKISSGGSLIGQIPQIGIIGFVLAISFFAVSILKYTPNISRLDKLVVIGPFVATNLVSQPLLDAPGVFLLVIITTCSTGKIASNKR